MKASVFALAGAGILANAQSITLPPTPTFAIDPNSPLASSVNQAQLDLASQISSINSAVQASITALTQSGADLNIAQNSIQAQGLAEISSAQASLGSLLSSLDPQPTGSSGSTGASGTASQTQSGGSSASGSQSGSGSASATGSVSQSTTVGTTTNSDGQTSTFTSVATVSHSGSQSGGGGQATTTSPNAAAVQTAAKVLVAGAAILAAAL